MIYNIAVYAFAAAALLGAVGLLAERLKRSEE
jgi:hypothetical protein